MNDRYQGSNKSRARPSSGHRHQEQLEERGLRKGGHKRTLSSTLWLQRQRSDPYVAETRRLGYRSRAAFKLLELDEKLHFLKPGQRVVDLGAAPGGWTQVAVTRVRANQPAGGQVVAIDLNAWTPVLGATCLTHDFMAADGPAQLEQALGSVKADVVLSDMSPNTIGHRRTDSLRILVLVEAAYAFALNILAPGGIFVAKVFHSGMEHALLVDMKRHFTLVHHVKPPASRKETSEIYMVAQGLRI